MTAEAWVATAAVVVTLLALTATVTYRIVQHESSHHTDVEQLRSRAERAEAEAEILRTEFKSLLTGRTGPVIKTEIDRELLQSMNVLQAQAASVLIQAPPPNQHTHLVFLSVFGPVANRIRKDLVEKDSIAGMVMRSGRLENVRNPRGHSNWNRAVDVKSEFETTTLLTVPLPLPASAVPDASQKASGVCQFLNRTNEQPFTRQDEQVAEMTAHRVAPLVQEFIADERNFETLGLPLDQPYQEASVMFCDLTSSTELLDRMNTASAILRLDEYLENLGEIAIAHGAKLFTNLGDGMLLSFNVPKPLDYHPRLALDAAWKMQQDFQRICRGWQMFDLGLLHNRIAVAVGPVLLATVGPKQFRQETIFGPVVNLSNKLCRVAPRDGDVIVVDEETRNRVDTYLFEEIVIPDHRTFKVPPRIYKVLRPRERRAVLQ